MDREQEALRFKPEEWGMAAEPRLTPTSCFSTSGPQHPGTHGVLRIVLQLDGETIVDCVPDIGYHHRGAEKMGERQSWHTYIPYTDRVDYLGGVMNNLAYLTAVEKLAGITVPPRAQVIRVMLCELFRIISHLVWYGTFAQDRGPAVAGLLHVQRPRAASTSSKRSPARACTRTGSASAASRRTCRDGWERWSATSSTTCRPRLRRVRQRDPANQHLQGAHRRASASYTTDEAIEWGVTGPNLRACGFEWDFRKKQPYSGYEQFEFDIPTGQHGDCYDRARGARGGDAPEPAHHRAVPGQHAGQGPYKSDIR